MESMKRCEIVHYIENENCRNIALEKLHEMRYSYVVRNGNVSKVIVTPQDASIGREQARPVPGYFCR